jgi:hypothetical protein
MKVYSDSMYGRGTIFVTPGNEHPENSEWVRVTHDDDGREVRQALQLAVTFKAGMAEVSDGLGRYLINHKLAKRSPLIIPEPLEQRILSAPILYQTPIAVGRPLVEARA